MSDSLDLGRREFMQAGVVGVSSLSSGGVNLNVSQRTLSEYEFQGAAHLVGPDAARPAPSDAFFDNKLYYAYLYEATDTGLVSFITQDDSQWETQATVLKSYARSDLPSDPPAGSIFWNSDRSTQTVYDGEDYEVPVVGDAALESTAVVENTTTETTVFSTDLSPDSMEPGRVYEVDLYGGYSTNDSSDQFTLRAYFGGQKVSSTQSVAANASNAPITARFYVTVRSTGGSGSVVTHTEAIFADEHMDTEPDTNPITVDTTAVNSIEATVQWNVAEAGDRVEITQGHMKEVT